MDNSFNKSLTLNHYLAFALSGEFLFILIMFIFAYLSGLIFKTFPDLLLVIKELMAGIVNKVEHTTSAGMAVKIFINNLLISVIPLAFFSLQLLPARGIKNVAVALAFFSGLFIYITNAVVLGLSIGMLATYMQVSYLTLILASMVHGLLELFAVAVGTLFAVYYRYVIADQKILFNSPLFYDLLPQGQYLLLKLLPVMIVTLATAALLEVYVSAPLAVRILS